MTTTAKPGALKEYHPLRDQLALAAAEIIRLNELLDGLSDNGGWANCAGLLAFGFVAGAVAGSVLVAAVVALA